nr:muts protein like 4 [Quercus suber]
MRRSSYQVIPSYTICSPVHLAIASTSKNLTRWMETVGTAMGPTPTRDTFRVAKSFTVTSTRIPNTRIQSCSSTSQLTYPNVAANHIRMVSKHEGRQLSTTTGRPGTARLRTGLSTLGVENQEIICAVNESRGISPTVGLAFVNLDTNEAVLSQINDSQTYVRTIHKLMVYNPTMILFVSMPANTKSKLYSIIKESLDELESSMTLLDRRYWAENTGLDYVKQLAFTEDVDAIMTAVEGNYYAVCCLAATLKYVELGMSICFPSHSLRVRYEPPEGCMMVDLATIRSLELMQNSRNAKSKACLFGILNNTETSMGSRLLRSNILQPLTSPEILGSRYDALEELSTKEDLFYQVRSALKIFPDTDKMLTQLILVPIDEGLKATESCINNVIMLKEFLKLIKPVFEALTGVRSAILRDIREHCMPERFRLIQVLIDGTINENAAYASQPLDLRNQRIYAVKSGVNGLLDVARLTYKEATGDALQHIEEMRTQHKISLTTKFDGGRQFYLRLSADDLGQEDLPPVFINVSKKRDIVECQTLDLIQRNQKISDAHMEVVMMSDQAVRDLIKDLREHMSVLFKISESISMLDMLSSFAHLVTSMNYTRPIIQDALAFRASRHPILEKIQTTTFIPNDVYATQQARFQVITGCNMSGKSTYIRSIAFMTIMAQIGCFVPAKYASFPIIRQLFARVCMDDNIEANVSTFSSEMSEAAFILRNVDNQSMVFMDELGRGTSTRDGLAITIAIAEALIGSKALVWFVTHFRDLSQILAERNGVVNLHLAVDTSHANTLEMLYRVADGTVEEEHYGLKLAGVMPFPVDVLAHAERVSFALEKRSKIHKKTSLMVVQARRRRLLLNLKEHLVQARNGSMSDKSLSDWLRDLQREFVTRMAALEDEVSAIEEEIEPHVGQENDDQCTGQL